MIFAQYTKNKHWLTYLVKEKRKKPLLPIHHIYTLISINILLFKVAYYDTLLFSLSQEMYFEKTICYVSCSIKFQFENRLRMSWFCDRITIRKAIPHEWKQIKILFAMHISWIIMLDIWICLEHICFHKQKIVPRLYKKGYQTIFDFHEMINLTLMLISDCMILE